MKKTVKKHINEISRIVKHMPKTLNEAVYEDFSGYDITEDEELGDPMKKNALPQDGAMPQDPNGMQAPEQPQNVEAPIQGEPAPDQAPEAPMGADVPEDKDGGDALNIEQFVDDIRKKSLRGMAQLAESPEDERYQLLKKIWQICDKKPEQQTAFGNPNAQMPQKKF